MLNKERNQCVPAILKQMWTRSVAAMVRGAYCLFESCFAKGSRPFGYRVIV